MAMLNVRHYQDAYGYLLIDMILNTTT